MAEIDQERQEGLPDWSQDPAAVLRRRWPAMLAALLLGIAATGVAAWLRTPMYLAEAKVLLAGQKVAEELVRPTMQGTPLDGVDALAAEAMSTQNLLAVIEELKLYPELRASMSPEALVATMRGSIRIDATQSGGSRPPPVPRFATSRVISIGFEAADPTVAAAVATRLAHLFQTEGLRLRGEQVRLATEFLRREVATAEAALQAQKEKIAAYEGEHRGELPSDLEANQRRLERLQDQRDDLVTSAAEAETRLATAIAQSAPTSPGAGRLSEARAALARQQAVNTETHPNVIALKREIAALQREKSTGGGGVIVEAARREVEQYRKQIEETDAELAALDVRIARAPSHEAALAGLLQHAKALEDNHAAVLGKLNEAELGESLELAQQGGQVAVLQDAAPPVEPEKGRLTIVAAGLLASLALAVGVALLLELRDPVIATAKGVESIAGVPVLGVMPRVS